MRRSPRPGALCEVEGCDRPHSSRGFCTMHYSRWSRNGDPLVIRRHQDVHKRFWAKATLRSDGCLIWQSARRRETTRQLAHGQFHLRGRMALAHRVAYELTYGPIPPGLVVRHLCHEPLCVNPDHLLLGTVAENNQDRARWNTAAARLAQAHPEEFARYLDEEMAKVGVTR